MKFTEIMKNYVNIIENKQHSSRMLKRKISAWDALSLQFNSETTDTPRTTEQLKVMWRGLKAKAKKANAIEIG